MAEARSIALVGHEFRSGVGLSVDSEGLHIRTQITIPPAREALRRLLRRVRLSVRLLAYLTYPLASPAVVVASLVTFVAIVLAAPRDSWLRSGRIATWVWEFGAFFPWLQLPDPYRLPIKVGTLAAWTGLAILIVLASIERTILKLLLADKTWLYAGMGRSGFSPYVKAWFMAVKALTRGRPMTYAFQGSMPRQPVPGLTDTVDKYLEYARVLQSDAQYEKTEEAARNFLSNEGPKLQRYLHVASWFKPHYMTEWWEKYVYLKGRAPIAINSNYYVLDSGRFSPTPIQEARAAVLTYAFMLYCQKLTEEAIPPVLLGEVVPMSMEQFQRMFATCRLPGRDADTIKHWDPDTIKHVTVACKGSLYKLQVVKNDGSLRTPDDLEAAFAAIKRDAAARTPAPRQAEAVLPVLTAENRTRWAEIRETHFAEGINRRSLTTVEQSLLYVVLEDTATELLDWTGRARQLFHGVRERPALWFDKSIQVIVYANGKAGLNCEHAWADAPVPAHCMEMSMIVGEVQLSAYDRHGHVRRWMPGGVAIPSPGVSPTKVVPPDEAFTTRITKAKDSAMAVHASGAVFPHHTPGSAADLRAMAESASAREAAASAAASGSSGDLRAAHESSPEDTGDEEPLPPTISRPASPPTASPPTVPDSAQAESEGITTTRGTVGTRAAAQRSSVMGSSITSEGEPLEAAAPGVAPIPGPPRGALNTALAPVQLGEDGWSRLAWALSAECEEAILQALANHQRAIDGVELLVVPHTAYGKDFIKQCRVSPDAYIQAAMQLAWYRDQGTFDNTYESSMTRLWLNGRTETVRPVTREMVAFVKMMEDKAAQPAEKLQALQAAAHRHVRGYTDAMAGRGIDRHLFALYVTSVGLGYDSPFLKDAISTPWRLSTSQQPQQQTGLWDIKDPKWATRISPGGGFGPVADDGLGVSYQALEREFIFHISSFVKASPKVEARRFRDRLFEAFEDMKAVLTLAVQAPKAKAISQAGVAPGPALVHSIEGATAAGKVEPTAK